MTPITAGILVPITVTFAHKISGATISHSLMIKSVCIPIDGPKQGTTSWPRLVNDVPECDCKLSSVTVCRATGTQIEMVKFDFTPTKIGITCL